MSTDNHDWTPSFYGTALQDRCVKCGVMRKTEGDKVTYSTDWPSLFAEFKPDIPECHRYGDGFVITEEKTIRGEEVFITMGQDGEPIVVDDERAAYNLARAHGIPARVRKGTYFKTK